MNIVVYIIGSAGLSLVASVMYAQQTYIAFGIAFISLISLATLYQIGQIDRKLTKNITNVAKLNTIKANRRGYISLNNEELSV